MKALSVVMELVKLKRRYRTLVVVAVCLQVVVLYVVGTPFVFPDVFLVNLHCLPPVAPWI